MIKPDRGTDIERKRLRSSQGLGQAPETGGHRMRQLLVSERQPAGPEKEHVLQASSSCPGNVPWCGRVARLGRGHSHPLSAPGVAWLVVWEAWSFHYAAHPGLGGVGRKQTGR